MKKFIVPILSVCLFIVSCSPDEAVSLPTEKNVRNVKLKNLVSFANSENQYDYIGEMHIAILDDCLENYNSSSINDVIDDVESVAGVTSGFSLISIGYPGLDVYEVEWAIDNAALPETLIDSLALTPDGKAELLDFVELLDDVKGKTANDLYEDIVIFERKVLDNTTLTVSDVKTILATTSIARFTIGYADDKDRQWSKTRTGIIASLNDNNAKAVTTSVTANIVAD